MKFSVLGLGEAGSRFANDLAELGHTVKGWDPNLRYLLNKSVYFAKSNVEAVKDADIIFSANEKEAALDIAREIAPFLNEKQFFCEMNTIAPDMKLSIAALLSNAKVNVIDLAIMAPVPPAGIKTPFLVSGKAAAQFQALTASFLNVTVKAGDVGTAAGYKLMRSIVYKGVAAVICEAMDIAKSMEEESYMRKQIKSILGSDELIDRFLEGSIKHANRRMKEMDAVCDFMVANDKPPIMAKATYENLKKLNHLGHDL